MPRPARRTHHATHRLLGGPPRCASSRRRRLRRRRDDESEADFTEQISEGIQQNGEGFDAEQADCLAAIVVDEIGVEALKDIDLAADAPPEELQEEITGATSTAQDECDLPEDPG